MPTTSLRLLFVGRENEQEQYLGFLKQQTAWVFLIVGMAGQGKTRLLDCLITRSPSDVLTIKLDFANRTLFEPLKILEEVSCGTEGHCDRQRTETFISILQDVRKQLLQQNLDVLNYLRDHNQAQRLDPDIQRKWQAEERELRQKVLEALYAQLSTYHGGRLVFMFDTCEWLNEPEDQVIGQWFKDHLLPRLHQYIPVPFSIILASRMRPQLEKINAKEQYLCELQELDEAAVNKYMKSLGIQDEEHWKVFFNLAHGHPLCLSIVATLWQEQQNDQSISDLPLLEKNFNEQAFIEFFQQRLDKRLRSPFRELTHYGVLLRSFDWELLRFVFQEDLSEPESYNNFEQFVTYSYIEEVFEEQGHKHYALHILLREVLADPIRLQEPEKWQCYHRRAFQYYSKYQAIDQHYHAIALDEEKGMDNWLQAVQAALDSSTVLSLLRQIDYDHTLKLSDMSRAIYFYALGHYHARDVQPSKAFEKYEQARDLLQRLLESVPKPNDETRILHYKAHVLQAMGDSKYSDKKWGEAADYYDQALELFRQQKDLFNEARTLQAIGQVKLNYKDQWSDAIKHYEDALERFREEKNSFEEARILQAIGDIKQSKKRTWEEAIEHYNRAFDLFQQQKDHYRSSLVLLSLGDTYYQHARLNQAYQSYQQALQQIDTGESKQPERKTYLKLKADVYERIGKVQQGQGKLHEAQGSYQQSLTFLRDTEDSASVGYMLQAINEVQKFSPLKKLIAPLQKLIAPLPQWMRIGLIVVVLLLIGGSIGSTVARTLLPPTINPCLSSQEPTKAISVIITKPQCGSETIGMSDGSFVFDLNRNNRDFKIVAANIQQQKSTSSNAKLQAWQNAIQADTSDAESYIYQEDLQVLMAHLPYITFVVTTVLTPVNGDFVGGGRDLLQGAYIAQKEHNDQCGYVQNSCPLVRLLIANSGGNQNYAIYIAKQIVLLKQSDSTFIGVMGWLNSSHTLKALPVLEGAHIPMVSSTASSDELTGRSPYFFRVNAPDQQQGQIGALYARDTLNSRRVALFYDPNDPYSLSLANAFSSEYIKKGGSIAVKETYTIGSSDSLLNKLPEVLTRQPDLIYFAGYARDISTLLVGLKNVSGQINVMGGDALYVPGDYTPEAQQYANFQHLYFTSFAYPDIWKHFYPTEPPFFQDYPAIFDPQNQHPNTYSYTLADCSVILTYDAINILIRGYQNAVYHKRGQAITSDDLREGLKEIDITHSLSGASGPIAFGPDGNPVHKTVVVLNGPSIDKVEIKQFYTTNQG